MKPIEIHPYLLITICAVCVFAGALVMLVVCYFASNRKEQ